MKRNHHNCSSKAILRYLQGQGVRRLEHFLRFQIEYSGYELTIKEKAGHTFNAHLFSEDQITQALPSNIELVGDRFLEICGDHKSAPFQFYLTHKGEVCTLDYDDLPNILHSSFDIFVEQYAVENEISNWDSNPYYFNVKSPDELQVAMTQYDIIQECSDEYNTWWHNGNIIANTGIWLDKATHAFHVYGRERAVCDRLVEHLKYQGILE